MCPSVKRDIARNHRLNGDMYDALLGGKADKVKQLCATVNEEGLHILTIHDDTVLHLATFSRQADLALDLLDSLPDRHLGKMTRQNHLGNTILHDAAVFNQSRDLGEKLLEKAPGLLCMRNHLGETALFRAVRYGNKKMFNFLAEKISGYDEANLQIFLQRSDKTTILHIAILVQLFDLALQIAKSFEHLIGERDVDGMIALQLLSCMPGAFQREDKRGFLKQNVTSDTGVEAERYRSALDLAKYLVERDTSWETTYPGIDQGKPKLHKHGGSHDAEKVVGEEHTVSSQGERQTTTPLFLATKTGCAEIVEEILKIYPQAIEHIDEEGRNILHIAIKYRHLKIFQLVAKREVPMKRMVQKVDKEGNSILHTVGLKVKDYLPERMKGPALILQEELLWFERVKEFIPPHFIDHRNHMNLTAEGLFATTNNELRTVATEWLKRTSEGGTVVAILIATVAFAAAYTVPGGPNSQTGFPVLLNNPLFVVFTVSDVLSLSFTLTSVVIFLSIVTSPFRLEDFLDSLPNKLMLGFTFLFLSVSLMMIAFAATVLLMIHKRESWTKVLLYALSFLPVGVFAFSYFPLYVSLSETYKYLLKKVKQAIPWTHFFPVLSRVTHFFGNRKTRVTGSPNPLQRQLRNNEEIEEFDAPVAPQTFNFSV